MRVVYQTHQAGDATSGAVPVAAREVDDATVVVGYSK